MKEKALIIKSLSDIFIEIDKRWVNEKNRRAIRVPLLCAMKYEMNDQLTVPNYTVVTADNGRTFYYIEHQKKRRFASKRDMQYFQFHQKEIYTVSKRTAADV